MNARTKRVLEEALELSADDRALVAVALEARLGGENDDESDSQAVEQAWADEIQRRVDAVRSGQSSGRSAHEVLAEIRSRLHAARGQ